MSLLYKRFYVIGASLIITGNLKSKVALMLFINEKESCQCTITYMVSAVKVLETTWSQDNKNEVNLIKRLLRHARGNTTRDIREEKADRMYQLV